MTPRTMPHPRTVFLARVAMTTLTFAAALLAPGPHTLYAQENPLGATAAVEARPLQELVRNERPPGLIYISIPFAEVFGGAHGYAPYCSPQIRTANASNRTVREMLTGIRYRDRSGGRLGSTVTRVFLLRVDAEENHFFANVNVNDCNGLTAEVEVIRCMYEDGTPCAADVVAVGYGAIPLAIAAAPEESR
jgi:hypothetical protein